jgi:hypothetical protein
MSPSRHICDGSKPERVSPALFFIPMRLRLAFVLVLAATVLTLADCSTDAKARSYTVRGVAQKGPAQVGATVTIQELTAQLEPAGKTYVTSTTDDGGSFRLETPVGSELIEIIVQGRFVDELRPPSGCVPVEACPVSATAVLPTNTLTLHTIARSDGSQPTASVNVNVLTHLQSLRLRKLIRDGKSFTTAEEQSRGEVLLALEIPGVPFGFNTLTLADNGDYNGELLAASVLISAASVDIADTADSLRQDLEDGILDVERLRNLLQQARKSIGDQLCRYPKSDRVKDALQFYYEQRGISASIPNWQQFFTPSTAKFSDGGVGCPWP